MKSKSVSRSSRAGLCFPVGRVERHIRRSRCARRVSASASVFATSIVEYLIAEVLELSGDVATENKKALIAPRHIQLAIRNDDELAKIFKNVNIANGGVMMNIHKSLVRQKK